MTRHSTPIEDQAGTSQVPTSSRATDERSVDASDSRTGTTTARVRWPRWGWIPYLLIGAFVTFWAVTHVGAVVSGAGSWKAVGFGIAAGVLTVAALVGVARLTRRGWAGQLAGLVPLVAAVVIAVLPSYVTSSVNEAAPEGLDAVAAPSASTAPDESTGSAPPASSAPPVGSSPAPPPPPPPAGPVEVGTAQFVGIDHDAAGVARLIQLEDGSLLVRFEQFSVESGPDYDVYVVSGANVSVPEGGTLLGDLKGTVGDQNYEIPSGVLPGGGDPVTVLIWCEVFAVPVANATI